MLTIPTAPIGRRYSNTYTAPKQQSTGKSMQQTQPSRDLKIAGACCPPKTCSKTTGCGCGCNNGGLPRYGGSIPGNGSGQSATMMMPNITINVQSGNRRSSDYTDMHSADTQYSPSNANPYTYAPTSTENNPTTSSFEHGGYYSSRYGALTNEPAAPVMPANNEPLPIVLSPRVKERMQQAFNPGPQPDYVGRRYPKEFP